MFISNNVTLSQNRWDTEKHNHLPDLSKMQTLQSVAEFKRRAVENTSIKPRQVRKYSVVTISIYEYQLFLHISLPHLYLDLR